MTSYIHYPNAIGYETYLSRCLPVYEKFTISNLKSHFVNCTPFLPYIFYVNVTFSSFVIVCLHLSTLLSGFFPLFMQSYSRKQMHVTISWFLECFSYLVKIYYYWFLHLIETKNPNCSVLYYNFAVSTFSCCLFSPVCDCLTVNSWDEPASSTVYWLGSRPGWGLPLVVYLEEHSMNVLSMMRRKNTGQSLNIHMCHWDDLLEYHPIINELASVHHYWADVRPSQQNSKSE